MVTSDLDFDFNMPIPSPVSHVNAVGSLGAAIPGFGPHMPPYPVSAAQMDFGGTVGAAAPVQHGFTPAHAHPAAVSGFHQASNHGSYNMENQYTMPGYAANMMWNTNATSLSAGFTPNISQQLAYPGIYNHLPASADGDCICQQLVTGHGQLRSSTLLQRSGSCS